MASSTVASAAKQLGALVAREAKYLYEVSNKIERLQRDLEWMQCFLEDADDRQHRERVVAKWVAEIRDFAYEAEEIVEKYLYRVSRHRKDGKWNTVKWFSCVLGDAQALYDVGSNIDDLRTRISELTSRMQMFGIQMTSQSGSSAYDIAMREQRRTYAHIEDDPVGLEEDVKEVVDKLIVKDSEGKVALVGISGMGGLGKTTLARRVFHNADVRKHFKNNCVWVYISKQFERKDIYQEILIGLSNIGKDDEMDNERSKKNEELPNSGFGIRKVRDLTDGEFPGEICKILKEKECLVVLDDLWKNGDWDTLKPAFEGIKSSGSKILITTRDNGVIQHADKEGYLHELRLLSKEESWKLFQRIAFTEKENIDKKETIVFKDSAKKNATPEEIRTTGESSTLEAKKIDQTNLQDVEKAKKEELCREMLDHCKGLPLAIKALSGLLSTKRTAEEWKTVKENISSYLMSDMVDGSHNKELSSVLELSYYDLPFYLKPCFLYLGIFPEDYIISADRLYHLWEAEGLVTTSAYGGDEIMGVTLDDVAESFLNQLVKRSMVQVEKSWSNGRIKTCRLHDMMRDLCVKKCKEVNFLNVIEHGSLEGPSNQIVNVFAGVDKKLRRCAIYLKGPGSLVDTSLNNFPCIRSLVIFPQGHMETRDLPSGKTRKALSLIRVLDLEGIDLDGSRPMKIANFIHLRYLSIKGSRTYLPSGIGDCKYLETVDLRSPCYMKLSNKFWKLERLRHLYLPNFAWVSTLLDFKTNQLQQMETFKNFHPEYCRIEDLGKMTNIKVFTLSRMWEYNSSVLTRDGMECLLESPMIKTKRLVETFNLFIKADVINGDPTILTTRVPYSSSCIRGIGIRGKIDVELNDSVQIFPHYLTSVKLHECEIGEDGIRMLEKLPQLKKLSLSSNGTKVRKISFSSRGFTQLVKLTLDWLDELEELMVEEEGALPNLQYLYIRFCERLKNIPEGLPSSVHIECFPCVKGIEYYNTCPEFRNNS